MKRSVQVCTRPRFSFCQIHSLLKQNHARHDRDEGDEKGDANKVNGPSHKVINEPTISLKGFTKERIPSTRYSPNEYVLLTDRGEPQCCKEARENEPQDRLVAIMIEEIK